MEQTLHQLGQLLLSSIPTILLFVGLHFYLKRVLYRPLSTVLERRAALTTGRRQAAAASLAQAEQKLATYEDQIRNARQTGYRAVEARRQQALTAAQARHQQARHEAQQALLHARQQLAAETAAARASLQAGSESLAARIIDNVAGLENGVGA